MVTHNTIKPLAEYNETTALTWILDAPQFKIYWTKLLEMETIVNHPKIWPTMLLALGT